jgi:hypothetical protein
LSGEKWFTVVRDDQGSLQTRRNRAIQYIDRGDVFLTQVALTNANNNSLPMSVIAMKGKHLKSLKLAKTQDRLID